jgi:hypothetical protein
MKNLQIKLSFLFVGFIGLTGCCTPYQAVEISQSRENSTLVLRAVKSDATCMFRQTGTVVTPASDSATVREALTLRSTDYIGGISFTIFRPDIEDSGSTIYSKDFGPVVYGGLKAGTYHIKVRGKGFEPVDFDVEVASHRKIHVLFYPKLAELSGN